LFKMPKTSIIFGNLESKQKVRIGTTPYAGVDVVANQCKLLIFQFTLKRIQLVLYELEVLLGFFPSDRVDFIVC
jgi:hypothetical protein